MYSFPAILSAILVFIVCIWVRRRKEKFKIFQRNNVPGPKPDFFLGNLPEFHKKRKDILQEWIEKYGKTFGFFLGTKPYLVSTDVELLKHFQIKDVRNSINKDWIIPNAGITHKSADHFLLLLQDEKWKNLRKALSSCFSSGKIKMMSTLMSNPINIFLKNIKDKNEKAFDIAKLNKALLFDIICTSAFGVNTNVQNNESNLFIESVHTIFSLDSTDILALLAVCFPETEPLPTYLLRFRDTMRSLIAKPAINIVYNTCKNIVHNRKQSNYHPPDILQTIIDAEDDSEISERNKLSDDIVIANAMLFMAAGYDTTNSTVTWCIYYLAQNPEVQKKLRQEINDNVQRNTEIQYTDLNNLQYLDQVISETLRFWQFCFLGLNRLCTKDFHYKDMTIPKGTIVTVPVPFLHNDPTYWHEPHKFDPERFSPDKRGNIDSMMYQPFGAGPRMCIGMRLAKTMIKLIITNLVRSFQLEPYGEKEIQLEYTYFVNYPKNGIFIKAIPINS